MLMISTGLRNSILGDKSLAETMGDMVCKIYSGSAPATADDEETGQLLVTITNGSKTVKAKQKVMVTATVANSFNYSITLNGVTVTYTSSASATADEISSTLKDMIDVATGVEMNSGFINNPKVYGLFTTTDVGGGSGQIAIESAIAGVAFNISVGDNLRYETITENAYGIHFEPYSGVENGIIEKKSGEVWSGVCVATGTAGYARLVRDDDDGTASTTQPRLQGTVATANADVIVTSVNFAKGATQTIDLASVTMPAHR